MRLLRLATSKHHLVMPRVTSPHVRRDVDDNAANGGLVGQRTMSQEEVDEQLFAEVEAEVRETAGGNDKDLAALEAELADVLASPKAEGAKAAEAAELPLPPADASSYSFDGTEVRREEKWVRKDGKFQKVNRDGHLEAQVEAELEQDVQEEEEERRASLGGEGPEEREGEEKPRWIRRAEQSAAGSSYTFDGSEVVKETKAAPVHPSKQLSSEDDADESDDDEEIRALQAEVAALEAEVDEQEDDEDAIEADLAKISEDLARLETEERSDADHTNSTQAKAATEKIATGAARQATTRLAAGRATVAFTAPAVSAEQTNAVPAAAAAAAAPAEGVLKVMPRPGAGRAAVAPVEAVAAPAALMTPQTVGAPTTASPVAKGLTPDDGIEPWMREMQQLEQSIANERSSQPKATTTADVQPNRGPKQMKKMKSSTPSLAEKPKLQPEPEPEPAPAVAAAPLISLAEVKCAHLAGTNPFDTPPREKQKAQVDSVPAAVPGGVAAPLSLQLAPPAQQLRSMTAAQLDSMTEKLAAASQWLGLSYPARDANVTSKDGAKTGDVAVNATGLSLTLRSRAANAKGTPTKTFKREHEVCWKDIRAWYVLPNGVTGDGEPQVLVQLANHEELVITPLSAGGAGDSGSRSANSLASAVATAMAKEMAAASAEAARHYSETKKAREMDPNSSFDGERDLSMSVDWEDVSVISADGSAISTPTGAAAAGLPWPPAPAPAAGAPAEEGVPPAQHAPAPLLLPADQWPAGSAATATPPSAAATVASVVPELSLTASPSAAGLAAPQLYRSLTILAEFEGHLSTALALQPAGAAAGAAGDGGVMSFVSVAQEAAVALRGYQDDLLALAAWTPPAQAESKLLKLTGAAARVRADVTTAPREDLTV